MRSVLYTYVYSVFALRAPLQKSSELAQLGSDPIVLVKDPICNKRRLPDDASKIIKTHIMDLFFTRDRKIMLYFDMLNDKLQYYVLLSSLAGKH